MDDERTSTSAPLATSRRTAAASPGQIRRAAADQRPRQLRVPNRLRPERHRSASILQAAGKKPLLRGDMEDWLKEKKAADDRWVKTAAIAAIVAAVFAFLTWVD